MIQHKAPKPEPIVIIMKNIVSLVEELEESSRITMNRYKAKNTIQDISAGKVFCL